jgi:hypothetical protein
MGLLTLGKEGVKAGVKYGIPITYIKNLIKDLRNNPDMDIKSNLKNAFDLTGKDLGKIYKYITGAEKKNTGGMAYARKKNMGLKMNAGGSVKSKKSKKKSRGTGAAKRGTKFKGTF